jgi:hypothetical protein
MVHLWFQDPRTMGWSRSRAMRLQTQKLSVGSSSLQPVSGLHYIRQKDALVISLFDGSLHVIHDLSREPSWNPSTTDHGLTSQKVSEVSRSLFTQAELRSTGNADVNRISGLISYDGYSTVLWVHEYAISHDVRALRICLTNVFLAEGLVDQQTAASSTMPDTIPCSLSLNSGTTPTMTHFCGSSPRS